MDEDGIVKVIAILSKTSIEEMEKGVLDRVVHAELERQRVVKLADTYSRWKQLWPPLRPRVALETILQEGGTPPLLSRRKVMNCCIDLGRRFWQQAH